MDKKYIERPKLFDKKEYDKDYKKKHYKHFSVYLTPELKERLDNYCRDMEISKSEFIKRALDVLEDQQQQTAANEADSNNTKSIAEESSVK